MVRAWSSSVIVVCIVLAALLAAVPRVGAAAESSGPPLSVWVYSYVEETEDYTMDLSTNGSMKVACDGLVDIHWIDGMVETVQMTTTIETDIEGWVREYDPFLGWSARDVWGTYDMKVAAYYDAGSGVILRSVLDEALSLKTDDGGGQMRSVVYYEEHNETDYSGFYTDPPGFSQFDIVYGTEPGTEWSEGYRAVSEVSGLDGWYPFNESWDREVLNNYTHIHSETLTTPVGDLMCILIHHDSGSENVTEWYCRDVHANAKIRTFYDEGEMVCVLQSYDPGEPAPGDDDDGNDEDKSLGAWLIPAVSVPIVAVAAAVTFFVLTRRRQMGRTPPAQGGGEVG